MGQEKIEVNISELDACIIKLKDLNNRCETSYSKKQRAQSVKCKGGTPKKITDVMNQYNDVRKSLSQLIKASIEILENAKDGVIDLDEGSASKMYKYVGNSKK